MQTRTATLIALALLLAALYGAFFIDWRKPENIRISCRIFHPGTLGNRKAQVIQFLLLDPPCDVTALELVSSDEARTNPHPHAFWRLTASGRPARLGAFSYGARIANLQPTLPSDHAEKLPGGGSYTLIVHDGKKRRGEVTFQTPPDS